MPIDILPQFSAVSTSTLLPEQERALVRELCAVAPWLTYREAVYLLDADPFILDPLGKAYLRQHPKEYQAALRQAVLPLERAGMSVGAAGLGQEAEGVAAVAIGCSQVKELADQFLNISGAAGGETGVDVVAVALCASQIGAVLRGRLFLTPLVSVAYLPAARRRAARRALASVQAGAVQLVRVVKPCKIYGRPISSGRLALAGFQRRRAYQLHCQPLGSASSGLLRVVVGKMLAGNPPICITGGQSAVAQNPNPKPQTPNPQNSVDIPCAGRGVTLKPDWLQFTMPVSAVSEVAEVERLKVLLGGDWQELEGGMYRYQKRLRCGSLWILWQGVSEGMGVHVQASGQGISELEARGVTDWREWFRVRLSEGAKFRRADMAYDVKDGSLTVDMVEEAARAGLVSSHFDTLEPVIKFDGQGNVTDRGFNFGNRAADTFVCFYDKALEQRKKRLAEGKKEPDMQAALDKQKELEASWPSELTVPNPDTPAANCAVEQLEMAEPHTRCELRLRNERAQKCIEKIVADGWRVVACVLSAALDIKERGEGKQRCRWNTVQWWSDFLGDAEKARLVLDPVIRTLQAGMVALERQYGPLLAACGLVVPNFWDWAQGVALRRLETLSRRHWGMVGAYVEQRDAPSPNGEARRVAPLGAGKVVAI